MPELAMHFSKSGIRTSRDALNATETRKELSNVGMLSRFFKSFWVRVRLSPLNNRKRVKVKGCGHLQIWALSLFRSWQNENKFLGNFSVALQATLFGANFARKWQFFPWKTLSQVLDAHKGKTIQFVLPVFGWSCHSALWTAGFRVTCHKHFYGVHQTPHPGYKKSCHPTELCYGPPFKLMITSWLNSNWG